MKFFKDLLSKLRPFDIIIIALIIIALIIGALTYFGKRATSSKQIEATANVEIEVYLRGVVVTSNNSPFEEGDETFITIRNVPYTKLKITRVNYDRKKALLPSNGAKKFEVVDDVTQPFNYDFLITVQDSAKITKDGAVVGGNKIKIGLPVTLEGVDYRLNGIVSNITLSKQAEGDSTNDDIQKQVNKNQDVH